MSSTNPQTPRDWSLWLTTTAGHKCCDAVVALGRMGGCAPVRARGVIIWTFGASVPNPDQTPRPFGRFDAASGVQLLTVTMRHAPNRRTLRACVDRGLMREEGGNIYLTPLGAATYRCAFLCDDAFRRLDARDPTTGVDG